MSVKKSLSAIISHQHIFFFFFFNSRTDIEIKREDSFGQEDWPSSVPSQKENNNANSGDTEEGYLINQDLLLKPALLFPYAMLM